MVVLASSPEPAHSKSNGDDHVDKKLVLEQQDNDDAPADRSWLKKICGIGPDDNETPESHLVYPLSPFGIFWLCLTAFFLG